MKRTTGHKLTNYLGEQKEFIRKFVADYNYQFDEKKKTLTDDEYQNFIKENGITIEKEDGDSIIVSGQGKRFEFKPKAPDKYKDLNTNKSYYYYNVRARLNMIFEINKQH